MSQRFKKIHTTTYVVEFFLNYNIIDTSHIIDIHEYLMKKRL